MAKEEKKQIHLQQLFVTKEASDPDPAPVFKFWVTEEISQGSYKYIAEFKECSGLRLERKVDTHKEGGRNDYVHKLPAQVEQSNITLKYGVLADKTLWEWFEAGLYDGKVKRFNLSILLHNTAGEVVRTWNVLDAFPVKLEGPQLNAEGNQLAIETLEIAHHGLKLA